jgi:predicted component of viral defense system (DUF524 family)
LSSFVVNLTSWKVKMETDHLELEEGVPDIEIEVHTDIGEYREHVAYRDGVVTIGCVGKDLLGGPS